MFSLVKFDFSFVLIPSKLLNSCFKRIFNFMLPNKFNLIKGRIIFSDYPIFNQITLCEGAGTVEIGSGCIFGYKLGGFHRNGSIEFQARYKGAKIKLGNNVATNNNIMLLAANYIEVGDNSRIGQYVTIMDHETHGLDPLKRKEIGEIGKVVLGRNVWVGNNVTILKNSVIGENTIVAAGAVVAGVFPANVIIGGVPAKVIKKL